MSYLQTQDRAQFLQECNDEGGFWAWFVKCDGEMADICGKMRRGVENPV